MSCSNNGLQLCGELKEENRDGIGQKICLFHELRAMQRYGLPAILFFGVLGMPRKLLSL